MIKKSAATLLFLGLALFLATKVSAATTGSATVSFTIQAIDALNVSNGAGISLTGTAGATTLSGSPDTGAVLNYTHNSTTTKKITAQVTTNPSGQNITLTVEVASGAGQKTIVTAGTAAAAQTVYSAIPHGVLTNKTVTYGASATVTGTPVGYYDFVITYTSTAG
jgi:hypothetical protein